MLAALLVTLLSVTTALLCYLTRNLYVRFEVPTAVSITVDSSGMLLCAVCYTDIAVSKQCNASIIRVKKFKKYRCADKSLARPD